MRKLTRVATVPTIALALALLAISPATAQTRSGRVAVILGNGDYRGEAYLRNPRNDASEMKRALEMLGFQVHMEVNASKEGLVRLGEDAKLWFKGSDVGLFFYAGHGLQINGENFIVPVDASFDNTTDISSELFSMSEALAWMNPDASANLIFLDACRKNPFTDVIRNQANAGRTIRIGAAPQLQVGQGLAEMNAGARTLIAYATEPGNVAADGEDSNSPFTKGILRHIRERGKEIREFLTSVRTSVLQETSQRQVPWDHSSLVGQFYFIAPVRARDIPIPPP